MSKTDAPTKKKHRAPKEDEAAQAEREQQQARELFDQIAARAARRNIEIKALEQAQNEDKAQLKALIGAKIYKKFLIDAGEHKFSMLTKPYRRINEKRAADLFGERVMELKVTSAAVQRAGLTEAEVNAIYDESTSIEFDILA